MSSSASAISAVPVGHVNEVVLEVADLDVAEGFYTRMLGLPVIDRWGPPNDAVWCMAGHCRIGLWLPQVGIARSRGGVRVHFAMSVAESDYDGLVVLLRDRGVRVDEVGWSRGARSAFVSDPDSNVLEFWTFDPCVGLPGSPRPLTGGIFGLEDHNSTQSCDLGDHTKNEPHSKSCYWNHESASWVCRSHP